jgi:hypothetical protein
LSEEEDEDGLPWGTQLASASGFASAVNERVSLADRSTPVSVHGCEAEMVKEYSEGLADAWLNAIKSLHRKIRAQRQ